MDLGYHYSNKDAEYPFRGLHEQKIPLFDELLKEFKGKPMNIEIKENENQVAEMLLQKLHEHLNEEEISNVIVASRWCEVMDHFRSISENKIATSACEKEAMYFLISTKFGLHKLLYSFLQPKAVVYQIPTVSSGIRFDENGYVEAAHLLGQRLMYWVINNEDHMKKLFELGVDGVVTDRPDIAHQLQHKLDMVRINKMNQIEKKYINNTKGFYIPEKNPDEIHQCVSIGCIVLPWVLSILHYRTIIGIVGIIVVYKVMKTRNEDRNGTQDTSANNEDGNERQERRKKAMKEE